MYNVYHGFIMDCIHPMRPERKVRQKLARNVLNKYKNKLYKIRYKN